MTPPQNPPQGVNLERRAQEDQRIYIYSINDSQTFFLRDLLVGSFPINKNSKAEVLSPIVIINMH